MEPSQDDIHRQPWKYLGYRRYAQFISSDDDLLIFRKFNDLSVRIALRLQDRISVLETRLTDIDISHSKKESNPVHNGTLRNGKDDRETIPNEIEIALSRYYKFLTRQSDTRLLPLAPKRDIKNIKIWHQNYHNRAIAEEEQSYLDMDDLLCLSRKDKPPLRQLIDNSLMLRTLSIWQDNSHPPIQGSRNVTYFSDRKINAFVSILLTAIGTAMLIIPIWILQSQDNLKYKLAVITVFVFVFLSVLSFAMVAKPFEALGATAA
ncbi:hypothetical protein F4819DRAFT_368578 [Hypoxylon fuscum]|nr:hypothetical protein F4819DRAFT_368578 [Hypoxylon fuscum]